MAVTTTNTERIDIKCSSILKIKEIEVCIIDKPERVGCEADESTIESGKWINAKKTKCTNI